MFSKLFIPIIVFESWYISIKVSNNDKIRDNSNLIKFDVIISNKNDIFSWIVFCKDNIEFKFSSVILSGVLLNRFNKLFIFKVFWDSGSIFFFLGIGPILPKFCSAVLFFSFFDLLLFFSSFFFKLSLFPLLFFSLSFSILLSFSLICFFSSSFLSLSLILPFWCSIPFYFSFSLFIIFFSSLFSFSFSF